MPEPHDVAHIQKHLSRLGHRVKDRVTGFQGVVTSVCFDLYGCVMAVVNPGTDKDGKPLESVYHDIRRLEVVSDQPVMDQPDFVQGQQAEGRQGPAEKPRAPG